MQQRPNGLWFFYYEDGSDCGESFVSKEECQAAVNKYCAWLIEVRCDTVRRFRSDISL